MIAVVELGCYSSLTHFRSYGVHSIILTTLFLGKPPRDSFYQYKFLPVHVLSAHSFLGCGGSMVELGTLEGEV